MMSLKRKSAPKKAEREVLNSSVLPFERWSAGTLYSLTEDVRVVVVVGAPVFRGDHTHQAREELLEEGLWEVVVVLQSFRNAHLEAAIVGREVVHVTSQKEKRKRVRERPRARRAL